MLTIGNFIGKQACSVLFAVSCAEINFVVGGERTGELIAMAAICPYKISDLKAITVKSARPT